MIKKKKYFSTNVKPVVHIEVSGPCNFVITGINEYGQVCLTFELDRQDFVDVFKLKNDPYEIERKKDERC